MMQIRKILQMHCWKMSPARILLNMPWSRDLLPLGAVAAMSGLATKIGTAFNTVGSQLTSAM